MNSEKVGQEVKHFIAENFLFSGDANILHDTNLFEASIIDSTGVLDLVAHLEKTYNIKIGDEELLPENFSTLTSIIDFVMAKV